MKHLLQSVPASAICQLVDDVHVEEIREELGLGALTGGALANVLKAAQTEGERILDDNEVGLAGPCISYVRGHARTVRRWLDSGRRFRVWTVDSRTTIDLCQELGIRRSPPTVPPRFRAQLLARLFRRARQEHGMNETTFEPVSDRADG